MITFSNFSDLMCNVGDCATLQEYIAECGGSVPLDDVDATVRLLSVIWDCCHDGMTIRSLAAATGRSMRSIAMDYKLPTRTVESWASGDRATAPWVMPLLAYAVIGDYIDDPPY